MLLGIGPRLVATIAAQRMPHPLHSNHCGRRRQAADHTGSHVHRYIPSVVTHLKTGLLPSKTLSVADVVLR
jgi:hypothetical protein